MPKKEITSEAIGALVRERRRKLEMSQEDLGAALGVSAMQVQHYETGRSSPTVPKLAAIAKALKCKTTDLIP